jgi:CelD/BcsL family acetyltransferase involved in cellulose biosynthesis
VKSSLSLHEIKSPSDLQTIRPPWDQLWKSCLDATPFQNPAWLIPWWESLGQGELRVLRIEAHDRLVALVPFYIYSQPESSRRTLLLLGTGNSDYVDALCLPQFQGDVVGIVSEYLESSATEWDECDLQQLRPGSILLQVRAPNAFSEEQSCGEPCPVLPLPTATNAIEERLPSGILSNLRYYSHRAEKHHSVAYVEATADNFEQLIEQLIQLHTARWTASAKPGVLNGEPIQRFHGRAAGELLQSGLLRIYGLSLDGQTVAVLYGFASHGRGYYYLGGFDPQFSHLSVGTLLIGQAIARAVAEGSTEFDFLRGQEPYKYRWGAADRPTVRRRFVKAGTSKVCRALP